MTTRLGARLAVALALLSPGCGRQLPAVVPVAGTVTLGGKPLPNVVITFIPLLSDFGSESSSVATTDADGKFVLVCNYTGEPGAVVGDHIVTVEEPALPDEFQMVQDPKRVEAFRAKLGNRPVPPKYGSIGESPLKITVAPGQPAVALELTR